MNKGRMEVIIFASKDDENEGFARAKNLRDQFAETNVPVRFIEKSGFVLADLKLVAEYRVISTPCVIVLSNGITILRTPHIQSAHNLLSILHDNTKATEGTKDSTPS